MPQYLGSADNLALFSEGNQGVVVDTALNLVVEAGSLDLVLSSRDIMWRDNGFEASDELSALISAAAVVEEDPLTAAASRMFTIPGGAQAEAKKALAWRKEEKRGGTPVGLNTARILAKGGQIGIEKVRHIAKYFPRHEVDKKGKGWAPGEDNFPSNGRIAWALWGGDAAQRWASTIVKRENALTADAYAVNEYDAYDHEPALNAFKMAHELDENFGPEFLARVRMDGSGFDRLYKVDIDGTVCVWDDCSWDDLGNVDSDIWTYDRALDDPYDNVGKDHVLIDASSAFIIAGLLEKSPHAPVFIDDIDTEEARLVALGLLEEDMSFVDSAITAATTPIVKGPAATKGNNQDGVDTPEERAARTENQPRNALGRFATAGQKVAVGGDVSRGAGTITKVDGKTGLVDVKLNSGATISVDAKYTQPLEGMPQPAAAPAPGAKPSKVLDTSGIFAKPRAQVNVAKATLPSGSSAAATEQLKSGLSGFAEYVSTQRAATTDNKGKIGVLKDGKITLAQAVSNAVAKDNKDSKIVQPLLKGAKDLFEGKTTVSQDIGKAIGKAVTDAGTGVGGRSANIPDKRSGFRGIGGTKPATTTKPGADAVERKGAPATPVDSRNAPGSNKPGPTDSRNAPGSNRETKPVDSRNAPGSNRETKPTPVDSRNAPGSNKETKPKAAPASKGGDYTIQKGDNLWSIAEKNKPAGVSTADYWKQILDANPKGKFKSGDHNLIYSGEKVTLPGKTKSTPTDSRNAPGSNRETKSTPVDSRNAPGSNKSAPVDSRNAPGSNRETKPADSRNAPGSNKPGPTDSRNAPGSNKSNAKPGPDAVERKGAPKTYSGPMVDPKTGKSTIPSSSIKLQGAPKISPSIKKTGTDATDVPGVSKPKTYSGPMIDPKTGKSTVPTTKAAPKPGTPLEGKKLPIPGQKYTGIKTKKTGK